MQGLAGSSELAQRYPAVAAAISGGIDNSMQAFAETYACLLYTSQCKSAAGGVGGEEAGRLHQQIQRQDRWRDGSAGRDEGFQLLSLIHISTKAAERAMNINDPNK